MSGRTLLAAEAASFDFSADVALVTPLTGADSGGDEIVAAKEGAVEVGKRETSETTLSLSTVR